MSSDEASALGHKQGNEGDELENAAPACTFRHRQPRHGPQGSLFSKARAKMGATPGVNKQSAMDYERSYEPDEANQEISSGARVWHVYNEEADRYDSDLVEGMSSSLDVLLIFAALFAGIVVALLSQTVQALDLNTGRITNGLLDEFISVYRANAQGGADISLIPHASRTTTPSTLMLWVNGLWFTSLNLSIACTLLSVLAKQWFHQYSAFKPGSARERAFTRQFRFDGLEKWRVPFIVGLLPTVLHASLGLFLGGLFLYLLDIRPSMAISVGILSTALGIIYLTAVIIPLFDIRCAYRTPFTDILSNILRYYCNHSARVHQAYQLLTRLVDLPSSRIPKPPSGAVWPTVREAERACVSLRDRGNESEIGERAWEALSWLTQIAFDNASVKSIVRQCLGAFPYDFSRFRLGEHGEMDTRLWSVPSSSTFQQVYRADVRKCCDPTGRPYDTESEQRLGRLLRAANATSRTLQLLGQPLILQDMAVAMVASVQTLSVSFEDSDNNIEHVAPYPLEWYVKKCGDDLAQLPLLPPEVWDSYVNLTDQLGSQYALELRARASSVVHQPVSPYHARPISFAAFLSDAKLVPEHNPDPTQIPLPSFEECEKKVNSLTGYVNITGEWLQGQVDAMAYGLAGSTLAVYPAGYGPEEVEEGLWTQLWNRLTLERSASQIVPLRESEQPSKGIIGCAQDTQPGGQSVQYGGGTDTETSCSSGTITIEVEEEHAYTRWLKRGRIQKDILPT